MEDNQFFNEQTENTEQLPEQTEEVKVKLGDKEYSQDELSQLVGVAEQTRELERKYNTKLDKVWPAYGQTQNEKKALEQEIADLKSKQNLGQDINPDDVSKAREAARKIGIVTQDDFTEFMKKEFRNLYLQERQTDQLIDETENLEKEVDGKDGRPKFDKVEILEYMQETGIKNPMRAYKDKYEGQLDAWKQKELSKSKSQGIYTTETSGAGNKQPPKVVVTKDNIDSLVSQALDGQI